MPDAKATVAGAFVLGGLALGVAAILLFGGTRFFTTRPRAIVYFQDSVAGLAVGAPVTLRGVRVGTVRSMTVHVSLPDLVPVIPVYLEFDPHQLSWTKGAQWEGAANFDIAVKAGLRAQLAIQSLVTGQLSVDLDFHPNTAPNLHGGAAGVPEIPSIPSDMERLKNQISELNLPDLAEKARVALVGIQKITGELDGKVGPIADSVARTSDAARTTLEAVTEAVRQLRTDASRTLGDIDGLATASQSQVAAAGKDIGRVLARTEKVIASLDDMAGARSPMRGDAEAAVRDLAASASSLRSLTRELERNPAILLGRSSR